MDEGGTDQETNDNGNDMDDENKAPNAGASDLALNNPELQRQQQQHQLMMAAAAAIMNNNSAHGVAGSTFMPQLALNLAMAQQQQQQQQNVSYLTFSFPNAIAFA